MNDRYATRALALAASLALALPGTAFAEDGANNGAEVGAEVGGAPGPQPEAASITYDEATSCMALYIILGSQFDKGSEESDTFRTLFAAWSSYSKIHYPVQFEQSREQDLKTQTDRLVDEFNAMSQEQFEAAMDGRIDACQRLEDAGQILQ